MNTLCEICNKVKDACFICRGKSASFCGEHNPNMTIFNSQFACKPCLETHRCTVNLLKPVSENKSSDIPPEEKNIIQTPSYAQEKKSKYCRTLSCNQLFLSFLWGVSKKQAINLTNTSKVEELNKKIPDPIQECNNIKKYCYLCKRKNTLNCYIHNPNIKNTCDDCVKLFLCQICNQLSETTWSHECGRFCSKCVKKTEIDISPATLINIFENTTTNIKYQKWISMCERCMKDSVLDIQKREYIKYTSSQI